jgi:glycosyltransferase involved in cell wall biosynthesis
MRIALIGTTAACVIGFRADMIKALCALGYEVYAFALDYNADSRAAVEELGAVAVDYEFSRTGVNPFSDIINTFKLSRYLKRIEPDIVFSYFSKPVIFGTLAAAIAGVKRRVGMLEGLGYVFTDHPDGESLKTKVLRIIQVLLYRISFHFLERIIFLNPDDSVDLLIENKIKVKAVSVLGGIGLELKAYPYSVPKTSPVSFIFVGRLLAEKGINEYIAAARQVKLKYSSAQFVMLGALDEGNPGGLSALDLKRFIDEGVVIHPGHVSDVQVWLANSSVFVLPSYREGVPRSTQEAMAIGRPVITSDVPGCRETVINGENGFLVPAWSAAKLAEKMIYFIEHPECVVPMGLVSFKLAQERFDAVKVNQKLISYLR